MSSRSCARHVSSRASPSGRARAPPYTSSRRRRPRRDSRAATSSCPTTSSPSRRPYSATASSCAPRPSSSATAPTTRSRPRSRRFPCRGDASMTPTARAVYALLGAALVALVLSVPIAILLAAIVAILTVTDWAFASERIRVRRTVPRVLARGYPASLLVEADTSTPAAVELRQPQPPDIVVEPAIGSHAGLDAQVTAFRRGEQVLPPIAARRTGPFGFGRRTFDGEGTATLLVYPD